MDTIQFPKTFDLRNITEQSETESIKVTQDGRFLVTGKLVIDSFNIHGFDVIQKISIKTKKPHNFVNVALLINNYVVHRAKPDSDTFTFHIFDVTGVVQSPKLFDVNFVCDPVPSAAVDVEITYHGIKVDGVTKDFLKYNQYYSVHRVMVVNDESPKGTVLVIYYAPSQSPSYNVKFVELKDIQEFMSAIKTSYVWRCPIIYQFQSEMKKESHRLISVECDTKIEQEINNDEFLKYESNRVVLDDGLINKSFVVPKTERSDIEGHLMSEYGLIPYVSIVKIPRADVDYNDMSRVFESQVSILKKIGYET